MAQFRKTPGGGLEVMSYGVWTHVPPEAAAEIERAQELLRLLGRRKHYSWFTGGRGGDPMVAIRFASSEDAEAFAHLVAGIQIGVKP